VCRPREPGALEEVNDETKGSPTSPWRLQTPFSLSKDSDSATSALTIPHSISFVIAPLADDLAANCSSAAMLTLQHGPEGDTLADTVSNEGSWTTIDTTESMGPHADVLDSDITPRNATQSPALQTYHSFQMVSPHPSTQREPSPSTVPASDQMPAPSSPKQLSESMLGAPAEMRRASIRRAAQPVGPTTRKFHAAVQKLQRGARYTRQVCVSGARSAHAAIKQVAHIIAHYFKCLNGRMLYLVIPLATVGGASVCLWHFMNNNSKVFRVSENNQGTPNQVTTATRALVASTHTHVVRLQEAVSCLEDGSCQRFQSASVSINIV
jgi:hypothetical protein